ncbi:hypothetical protein WG906_14220 [Pedobacter sp. P351]|uniref:hypothetical protein n=1 Tax=Pedobacter superstes TaxID=3133441 RepID=UPI00309CE020
MIKSKILVVITGNEYIRNYIQSDALRALESEYDCYFLGSDQITIREQLINKPNFLGFYTEDPKQKGRSYSYFNVLMYKNRNQCSSFKFRTYRTYYKPESFYNTIKLILSESVKLKFDFLRKFKEKSKVRIFSRTPFFNYYESKFKKLHLINPLLLSAIEKNKIDIVLFPSSAYDPIGVDIVQACRKFHIPSLFLIDNWDNLSSKSILFEKPDYLGVWSQQSLEHATEIQGIEKSNIFILGTPRFNHYFKDRDRDLPSSFNFRYILFVGTAVAFDEAGIITKINQVMEDNQHIFSGVKLLYRPHPWRHSKDSIADKDLPHLVIDPQLKDAYLKKDASYAIQPSLDYYPSLIKNSEFVMGGLTSMLIETLIFKKPYFALAYDDGINLTSPHNVLKYYVHFKGLENVEAIKFCTELQDFPSQFIEQWNERGDINSKKVDDQREYYLSHDQNMEYKDKLKSIVENIITKDAH